MVHQIQQRLHGIGYPLVIVDPADLFIHLALDADRQLEAVAVHAAALVIFRQAGQGVGGLEMEAFRETGAHGPGRLAPPRPGNNHNQGLASRACHPKTRPPMSEPRVIILIPSYNTGRELLRATVSAALSHAGQVLVVVDGSTDGSDHGLEDLAPAQRLGVHRLPKNAGKGSAVKAGLEHARQLGFTHALCMDADGQHPANAIPEFTRILQNHPTAAIFGRPVFDASAPALRVEGRKVSNFCANLETLGWGVDDSLFGMRLYPIQPLLEAFEETRFARRFDFDPEMAVRLAWKGIPIINLPTPVRYLDPAEGGVSQFRYLRDNTLLTGMHLRLFGGFLIRLPWLILRGQNPLLHLSPPH